MNEVQVRHDLIDSALRAAGWESLPAKVTVEQTIAPGPVSQAEGQSHNPEFADYVLMYGNRRIAVVEAKASDKNYRAGGPLTAVILPSDMTANHQMIGNAVLMVYLAKWRFFRRGEFRPPTC